MPTPSRSLIPTLVALLLAVSCAGVPAARSAELRAGLISGYDSFIDRFTILEYDTSEVTHEYYAGLDAHLRSYDPSLSYSLRSTFRYGNQTIDEYAEGSVSAGSRARGLVQARADLRLKRFREGSDYGFGNDYLQSNAFLSLGRELGGGVYAAWKSRAELIDYEERTEFDYDYRYLDTGLAIEIGSFFGRFASFSAAFGRRECPDTTDLGYDRLIGSGEGRISDGPISLELSISADRRGYDGRSRSSSWNVLSSAGVAWTRSGGGGVSLRIESELWRYDEATSTFFDNHFLRCGVRGRSPVTGTVALFVEPRLGWLRCPSFEEERYIEGSVVMGVDVFSGGSLWLTASYEPGYRDYRLAGNEIYSDFRLNRLSLMGSVTARERVMLTLFVSHDPEYHARRSDDFSMTLVSASVSVLF